MSRFAASLRGFSARAVLELGRIRYRLLAVNLFVVLVPVAGLEFARIYERQLLVGLERDMQNQAVLVRTALEPRLGEPGFEPHSLTAWLEQSARQTRTRIRLIARDGVRQSGRSPAEPVVLADSHEHGPPEGHEPRVHVWRDPTLMQGLRAAAAEAFRVPVAKRPEITTALAGKRATATRVARNPAAVYLFLAEPVRGREGVWGAVYLTRSTSPVLDELHRIRKGLLWVLALALGFCVLVTLLLAWSISRPLERLAHAARQISQGHAEVELPTSGGGEIAELATAFAEMTHKLELRHRYISEFAADVAHGFKSPLTSILGAAELLSEGAADEPEARARFLSNILLDAERLDRLVTRLLELSRIDASEALPAVIEIAALTRRVVARFDRSDAPVTLIDGCSIPALFGREGDVEIALCNLLDNAQRFSPPGRAVELHVSGRAGEAHVVFRVLDYGPGVPPEHHARVFERFFSTDADGQGSGLGLSIVKSVAEAHGGSVRVVPDAGEGACFELKLSVGRAASGARSA